MLQSVGMLDERDTGVELLVRVVARGGATSDRPLRVLIATFANEPPRTYEDHQFHFFISARDQNIVQHLLSGAKRATKISGTGQTHWTT
jgi:hypothetical protein